MKKTTTTKNQIIDYLQWSSDEYDDRVFTAYWNWCQHYGHYESIIQQMLAHAGINKWFISEYAKLENNFLQVVNVVPNRTKTLQAHYKACTAEIMGIYPKPLINAIKKNTDFIKSNHQTDTIFYAN